MLPSNYTRGVPAVRWHFTFLSHSVQILTVTTVVTARLATSLPNFYTIRWGDLSWFQN